MESKNLQRLFLSVFFFLSGFCFSSWTSRIPTIKTAFDLNDAALGTVLLAMPVSSLIGLPFSGWLVSRFDSRIPLTFAFLINAVALLLIGFANTLYLLIAAICLFAFTMRMINISINTQALTLQKFYTKKINGSFHGLWSTGGIAGVGCSTVMVSKHISLPVHLSVVAGISFFATLLFFRFLLKNDRATSGNSIKLGKPDPFIVHLGFLVFIAAICEGGMFDWSGIFFREVVHATVFTYGYLIFMICMATSRFASDPVIEKFGMKFTYTASALLISTGMLMAIGFATFWTSMIGFSLVGFGTGSVIPMTYSLAGTSKKYSSGLAISIIATYSVVGMLIGPPMIGYLSHAVGLRNSFAIFAITGFLLIPISRSFFRWQDKEN